MKRILVDETLFIYAKRGDQPEHRLLSSFLHASHPHNPERKFRLYMAPESRRRLGMYWFYRWSRGMMEQTNVNGFQKRDGRRGLALEHVRGTWRLPSKPWCVLARLMPFHENRCLMDLYLFANEAKASILRNEAKSNTPEQVISLDMCRVARAAHVKNLPILSYNTDYKHFCLIPTKSKGYMEYLEPKTDIPVLLSS